MSKLQNAGIGPARLMEIRLALALRGLSLHNDPQADYFRQEAAALADRPTTWPFNSRKDFHGNTPGDSSQASS